MLKIALPVSVCFLLGACAVSRVQLPTTDLSQVHAYGAHRIAFDASGEHLASGGLRGDIRVWSIPDGTALISLRDSPGSIRGLAWLDDRRLVSADTSGQVRVWDLQRARVIRSVQLDAVQNIAVSAQRDGLLVAAGAQLHRLTLPALQPVKRVDVGARVLAVAVSRSGNRVAVSTADGRVLLMDETLTLLSELPKPTRKAFDLRFSPDDRTLLAGGWFRLLVWDLEQARLEERATEHWGKVVSVDISPDGERWISLGRETDSAVRLVDAGSNQVLRRFKAHALCGWQVRFSPDGRYAASSAEDGSIHIYDLDEPYRPVAQYPDFGD